MVKHKMFWFIDGDGWVNNCFNSSSQSVDVFKSLGCGWRKLGVLRSSSSCFVAVLSKRTLCQDTWVVRWHVMTRGASIVTRVWQIMTIVMAAQLPPLFVTDSKETKSKPFQFLTKDFRDFNDTLLHYFIIAIVIYISVSHCSVYWASDQQWKTVPVYSVWMMFIQASG